MRQFLLTLPRNLLGCFQGWMLLWHFAAILLTFILVISDSDWRYFLATRSPELHAWMWPAVVIGMFLPIYLPLLLLVGGSLARNPIIIGTGWAVAQAELIAASIVMAYKAVTGRVHPSFNVGPDISRVFHFGFLRGGVFWGWPSSHTTIAFAMAAAVFTLFSKQRWLGCLAMLYAFYIGVGVSMTIHWLSDFTAGVIIGSAIGIVVGKNFKTSIHLETP